MKYSLLLGILLSFSAVAKVPSLFIKDSGKLLDVEVLIADHEEKWTVYFRRWWRSCSQRDQT